MCFIQFGFGQISNFSFKVNSLTHSYDSETQIYKRKYVDNEIVSKIVLSENELKLIKDSFDKNEFKDFPNRLACDNSIDVLPVDNISMQLNDANKITVCINSNCFKINKKQEARFNEIWNLVFSILENKNDIKKLKTSDIEIL